VTRLVLTLACLSRIAAADGGVILQRGAAAEFDMTIFRDSADISVLVEDIDKKEPMLDAQVSIQTVQGEIPLQIGRGANKLLYSSATPIPPGRYTLKVSRGENSATLSGTLPPTERSVTPLIYIGIVPVAIALYALNRFLASRRAR
jgi:hypothetical protein